MKPHLPQIVSSGLLFTGLFLATVGPTLACSCSPGTVSGQESESSQVDDWEAKVGGGPGPAPVDTFHPDRKNKPEPRRGGTVVVHASSWPKHMNYTTENSATTRRMLRETHENLIQRDWETWSFKPSVAHKWVVEDTLILPGGRGDDNANIHFGEITDQGESYLVKPLTEFNKLTEPTAIPKEEGMELQKGNVFTFFIRDDVKWHDGKMFDAYDAKFSHDVFKNPHVDCEAARYKFENNFNEVLEPLVFRLFYDKQYFLAHHSIDDITLLPRHVYDLTDPENKDHNPGATEEERGRFINDHPNNRLWIGLGPYKVTSYNDEGVIAERFDDYFDKENGGWVDNIRWRHISSDDTAKQALINGKLDYWERLRTEDYFGEFVEQKAFTDSFYKGLASFNYFGYTAWNTRRPQLSDPVVRKALGMCFNWPEYIQNNYKGLGSRMTGTQYYFSPQYDRSVTTIPYNPEEAEEMLLDAGWFDRDDDGVLDKDGVPLKLTFLMPTGNVASTKFGQYYKEELADIGVELDIQTREWATFLEALYERDFDCANLAWVTPIQSDPEQIWHSKQADVPRSSNHSGFKNPKVDEIMAKIQVELDDAKRYALYSEMQTLIYNDQPYLFGINQPKKFAASKRLRNLKTYGIDPGYRIREWFLVDADGASATEAGSPR